jgi:hypothetical protein
MRSSRPVRLDLTLILIGIGACAPSAPDGVEQIEGALLIDTNVVGGVVVRNQIPANKQRNLTYCVSNAFDSFTAGTVTKIKNAMALATLDWQGSADLKFVFTTSATCTATNSSLVFNVIPDQALNDGQATAPFPDAPDRGVHVGCKVVSGGTTLCQFNQTEDYYRRLFLHEVGHLLGFKHEFLNKNGTCAMLEGSDWEALTAYDPESSMNYVVSNGGPCVGTATTTYITNMDRQGAQKVYGIPWEDHGGAIVGSPAVSSWGANRLDVFVRGTDNQLYHEYFDGGWHPWEALGGDLRSAPAAVSWGPNRIDVFARFSDNQLHRRVFDGSWQAWEARGGVLGEGTVAATTWGTNRLDVFVRGVDDQLHHVWYNGTWQPWENLGGVLAAGPAATAWASGRLDIIVRGTNGNLHTRWFDGSWHPFASLGAPPGGLGNFDPAVSTLGVNSLDVWAVGASGDLYRLPYRTGWAPFEKMGSAMSTGVGAVSWSSSRIDLFGVRAGSSVAHAWFDGVLWR